MNAKVKALGDKIINLLKGLSASEQAAVHDEIERRVPGWKAGLLKAGKTAKKKS